MKNKIIILLIILVIVLGGILIFSLRKQPLVSVGSEGHVESTPVVVEKMRAIGQWEFLTLSDEEVVDRDCVMASSAMISSRASIMAHFG